MKRRMNCMAAEEAQPPEDPTPWILCASDELIINVVEWNDLLSLLHNIISACDDSISRWVVEEKQALFNIISFGQCWMMNIWGWGGGLPPLKIKIFFWQACNDKIQSAEQLVKRNWPGSAPCKMCVARLNRRITHSLQMCHVSIFMVHFQGIHGWPLLMGTLICRRRS